MKRPDLHLFAKAYPERFYQMGMAEQLLMGAAAGMAHEGAQPFVTTYAVFAARRAYDFIHQAIAEDNLDVKLVCALPGLTTGYGPSHQAAADLGSKDFEDQIRSLKPGERMVKERNRVFREYVPLLDNPWGFPSLLKKKAERAAT